MFHYCATNQKVVPEGSQRVFPGFVEQLEGFLLLGALFSVILLVSCLKLKRIDCQSHE